MSYAEPIPSKLTLYNALRTPKEEGLKPSDIIYIKDIRKQRESRPKVVGDIPFKSPASLNPHNVIEIDIYYKEATENIFYVRLPNDSGPLMSLKVSIENFS
jgi:hypothetical protein